MKYSVQRKIVLALTLVMMLPFFSACTTGQQYSAGGAAIGAAAGGIIGNQHRDRSGKGALIGAAVGALAGAAIGNSKENAEPAETKERIVVCPSCNTQVNVTHFPSHATVQCPICKSKFSI